MPTFTTRISTRFALLALKVSLASWRNFDSVLNHLIAHLNTNYRHFLLFVDEASASLSPLIVTC